jgi:hypothetical protein
MGIEPTAQAWEAWVLPLYDARALCSILVAFRKIRQPLPYEAGSRRPHGQPKVRRAALTPGATS